MTTNQRHQRSFARRWTGGGWTYGAGKPSRRAAQAIPTLTRSSSAPELLALLEEHGETDEPRHDRPDPRLLGDAAELGGLDQLLPGQGLPGPGSGLSRVRGRG